MAKRNDNGERESLSLIAGSSGANQLTDKSKSEGLYPQRAIRLRTAFDVRRLLARLINMTLKDELDESKCTKVGYLCGVLLRAIELSELEERIKKLEELAPRTGQGP
jgi:hypothetical protein